MIKWIMDTTVYFPGCFHFRGSSSLLIIHSIDVFLVNHCNNCHFNNINNYSGWYEVRVNRCTFLVWCQWSCDGAVCLCKIKRLGNTALDVSGWMFTVSNHGLFFDTVLPLQCLGLEYNSCRSSTDSRAKNTKGWWYS